MKNERGGGLIPFVFSNRSFLCGRNGNNGEATMNAIFGKCHCKNVGMGTYKNQVVMRSPEGKDVSIDTCIASEIGFLWHNGVKTLGSCCGHGIMEADVIVVDDEKSWKIMKNFGYKYKIAPSGYREYFLKTKRGEI